MINPDDIARKAAALEKSLAEKFGASSGPLDRRIRKVGRRVPARIRKDLVEFCETARLAGNPKLALRIDPSRADAAFDRAQTFLKGIDVADRRKGAVLNVLASIAFKILVVFAALMAVLVWRGFV